MKEKMRVERGGRKIAGPKKCGFAALSSALKGLKRVNCASKKGRNKNMPKTLSWTAPCHLPLHTCFRTLVRKW